MRNPADDRDPNPLRSVSPEDRFRDAAMQFVRQDAIARELRRGSGRCTEYSRGDDSIGDGGIPRCDINDPEAERNEELCANCLVRFRNNPERKQAMQRRSSAKARMARWYLSLTVPELARTAEVRWIRNEATGIA